MRNHEFLNGVLVNFSVNKFYQILGLVLSIVRILSRCRSSNSDPHCFQKAEASLQLFGATFRTAGYLTAALHQGAQTLKNSWSHGPTVPIQPDTLDPAGPGQMVMESWPPKRLAAKLRGSKMECPSEVGVHCSWTRCWKFHCSMLKGKTKMRSLDSCCNVL